MAPVLPYLIMVLMLIVRPRGLMGTREVDDSRARAGGLAVWGASPSLLAVAPLDLQPAASRSRSSARWASLSIFALSYNMLLGQTGLLSFGHAVYYGLGALFTSTR